MVKSFKYFVEGKNALNDIQVRASQLIQEDKVTGKLCFSVHPLDFLSSSENTYNWRSCHALDGDFRAGNLSYMLDKCTIICYLKGEDGVKLPLFPDDVPWNSKKWRMLMYISDDKELIFAGRQYPFSSEWGAQCALNELLERLDLPFDAKTLYCDWTDPVIKEVADSYGHEYGLGSSYIWMRGGLYKLNSIVKDATGSTHFNDVLLSSFYTPHYSLCRNMPWYRKDPPTIKVGRRCNCLRCGEAPITMSETFMCNNCELVYGNSNNDNITYCACCDRRIFVDDAFCIDGQDVCEDCARSECFYCPDCEEYHFLNQRVYVEKEDIYVCDSCAEERKY